MASPELLQPMSALKCCPTNRIPFKQHQVYSIFSIMRLFLNLETLETSLISWISIFLLLLSLAHFQISRRICITLYCWVDSALLSFALHNYLYTLYLCINRVCKYLEALSDFSERIHTHIHTNTAIIMSFNFTAFCSIFSLNGCK